MPFRTRVIAFAVFLLSSGLGSAHAQVLQARSFGLTNTNVSTNLVFDKFDPTLGALSQIIFNLNGHVEGTASYEYTSANPSTTPITLTLRASISLTRPDGSNILASIPLASRIASDVPAFDGVLDFSGTSGRTFTDLTGDTQESIISRSAVDLATFTGPGTISLAISAIGNSISTGSGNYSTRFTTMASASVGVTYVFRARQDVPEPASLVLISCGGVGLLLARRAHRRRSQIAGPATD